MKKTKKALLATALTGALVLGAGFGSYSWFTSEIQATGQLTNGTLEINNGNNFEENIVNYNGFAPSNLVFGDWLTVENTGTLDTHLEASFSHELDQNVAISAYKVGYIAIKFTSQPGRDIREASQIKLQELFDGVTNEVEAQAAVAALSDDIEIVTGLVEEAEFRAFSEGGINQGGFLLGDGALPGVDNQFWQLDEGQYIDLNFGVKLDENAGNEYQGVSYSAVLDVIAKQTDDGAEK
ncbi:TasA family protein [Alkalicoccobacillus porphyridii]|uniref:Spore coat-associated protein N n=1 Tax=Alkalicoccobacillus porphyridii TaxID=2597270 RepID=A0A553ZVE2_9BACI|nr:TasA family protein [Alkalicoccobacillus porphyridii]TSB45427.1 hypothetical protein FN960_15940 [Alkalicoccobacillus porphyridii]